MIALLPCHLLQTRLSPITEHWHPNRAHEGKDLSDAAMELDIGVVELSRLALLLRRKQNSLLIEGPQVDQTVEGETPGHAAQVLQSLLIVRC